MPDQETVRTTEGDPADDDSTIGEPGIGRTEAFSDGVFAIAMTLLALDVRLPTSTVEMSLPQLGDALLQLWPQYLALVISFFFIGIGWINHHRMLSLLQRVNTPVQLVNLVLLLVVTTMPFPTRVLAEQLGRPGEPLAGLVYNSFFVAISVVFTLLWHIVRDSTDLQKPGVRRALLVQRDRQYRYGLPLYIGVLIVGLISVPVCLALHLVLAGFFALPGFRKRPSPKPT